MGRFILFLFSIIVYISPFSYAQEPSEDPLLISKRLIKQGARHAKIYEQVSPFLTNEPKANLELLENFSYILKEILKSKKPGGRAKVLDVINAIRQKTENTIPSGFKLEKDLRKRPELVPSIEILWTALDKDYQDAVSKILSSLSSGVDDISALNNTTFFYYLMIESHRALDYSNDITIFTVISRIFIPKTFNILTSLATAAKGLMEHAQVGDLASVGSTFPSSRRESVEVDADTPSTAPSPTNFLVKKEEDKIPTPPEPSRFSAKAVVMGAVGIGVVAAIVYKNPEGVRRLVDKVRGLFFPGGTAPAALMP